MILGIPNKKKEKAVTLLTVMVNKRKTTVKNIQRLTGYLNFLNRVIVPGRVFTRRMYTKFSAKKKQLKPYHHINVDKEFKLDCKTWLQFLEQDSEANIYRPMIDFSDGQTAEIIQFYTDVSASKEKGGYGCVFNKHWAYGRWEKEFLENCKPSIEYLELAALSYGLFMWSTELSNRRFTIFCDNESVVHMINKFTSGCKNCMVLLRAVMLRGLQYNFRVFARHLSTKSKVYM